MNKRIFGAFLIMLFILGAVSMAPVLGHTTLGRPTGINPYRVRDSDTNGGHVPGPTGYVWPGGGKDWYLNQLAVPPIEFPGYQSPWGTYPGGAPVNWLQLRGNTYAPFGAILTSTEDIPNSGDLIFAINFTLPQGMTYEDLNKEYNEAMRLIDPGWEHEDLVITYTDVQIYIPPEFNEEGSLIGGGLSTIDWAAGDVSNIMTNAGTYYENYISIKKADVKDPFGPGWWTTHFPSIVSFSYDNDFEEMYYFRFNSVTAPDIAGRYFFKIFLNHSFPLGNAIEADGDIVDWDLIPGQLDYFDFIFSTMPAENWPALLVKGEIDPGIVEGTVRYGSFDSLLYQEPLALPGRVRLVGEATDPYTGELTGREVEARGYFNASANGHFEVEGVAPGVYTVFASAAGYPEIEVPGEIEVLSGKSIHMDIFLQPGAIVEGTIYAKHSFDNIVWRQELPVTVEIYDSNEWPEPFPGAAWGDVDGTVPDNWLDWEFEHLMSFSPINLTDSPYTSYVNGPGVIFDPYRGYKFLDQYNMVGYGSVTPRAVAFPWEPVPGAGSFEYTAKDPNGIFNGVGPAQTWWTNPASQSFTFRFGHKPIRLGGPAGVPNFGLYGCPTEFDGHIPQVFATWIDGLVPGTYYLRAWINGWVQTDISGAPMDYVINVSPQEWAGDIRVPMDLQLTGWINKTVHFHDLPGTLKTAPVRGPDAWRFMIVEARDATGTLVALNFTQVPYWAESAVITLNGFGMAGPVLDDEWESNDDFWYWGNPGPVTGGNVQNDLWNWNLGRYGILGTDLIFNPDQGWISPNTDFGPNGAARTGSHIGSVGMKFSLYRYRHIRDYGIMPGTYTIYVYMRGYVQQEFELASISLSGQPTFISNHMYRGGGINMTIYSIDWQHPRINRNWIWTGIEGDGYPLDFAREHVPIFVTNLDTETGMGQVFYHTRMISPYPGGSKSATRYAGQWARPTKDEGTNTIPWSGPSAWWDPYASKLKFNGSVLTERVGPDEVLGAYSFSPNDELSTLWHSTQFYGIGFLAAGWVYRGAEFDSAIGLETGMYGIAAQTYGYVMKEPEKYDVFVNKGYQADTKVNLMIGVNITVTVQFKKEGIFEHAPYAGHAIVWIYDEEGNVAGHSDYWIDAAVPTTQTGQQTSGIITPSDMGFTYVIGGMATAQGLYKGIDGYPNYLGDWTIMTDTWWRWTDWDDWYPPVPGLLHGYVSTSMIQGFIATGLTYEEALQCACNYLGPYEQRTEVIVPNAHLFGEASVVFELDERPLLTGQIAGFSWSNELRSVSWANVIVVGAEGELPTIYTYDGIYQFYANPGEYEMTMELWAGDAGYESQTIDILAPDGGTVNYNFLNMERSNIAIPEFSLALLPILAALGASLFVFRKAKKK